MKNNKKIDRGPGPFNIWVYGRGLLRGYILSLLLFLISSVIVTYTPISGDVVPVLTSIVMVLSVAYASIYTAIHLRSKGWLHGGIVGLLYIVILILLSKLFIPHYAFDRVVLYKIITSLVAGIVGGMIGINMK